MLGAKEREAGPTWATALRKEEKSPGGMVDLVRGKQLVLLMKVSLGESWGWPLL